MSEATNRYPWDNDDLDTSTAGEQPVAEQEAVAPKKEKSFWRGLVKAVTPKKKAAPVLVEDKLSEDGQRFDEAEPKKNIWVRVKNIPKKMQQFFHKQKEKLEESLLQFEDGIRRADRLKRLKNQRRENAKEIRDAAAKKIKDKRLDDKNKAREAARLAKENKRKEKEKAKEDARLAKEKDKKDKADERRNKNQKPQGAGNLKTPPAPVADQDDREPAMAASVEAPKKDAGKPERIPSPLAVYGPSFTGFLHRLADDIIAVFWLIGKVFKVTSDQLNKQDDDRLDFPNSRNRGALNDNNSRQNIFSKYLGKLTGKDSDDQLSTAPVSVRQNEGR